jgi:hypothetical protein
VEVPVGKKARKKIVESSEDEDLEAGAGGSRRRVRPFVGLPAFSTLPITLRQSAQAAGAAHGAKSTRQLPSAVADENEDQPVLVSVSLHVACACAQQVR